MEATASYPAEITRALEEHDRKRESISALASLVTETGAIAALIRESGVTCRWDLQVMISSGDTWIRLNDLKSMEPVKTARRIIAAAGFRVIDHHDEAAHNYFNVIHRHEGFPGRLILCASFTSDEITGKTCRYVQTGTKTVPTYELRCEQ